MKFDKLMNILYRIICVITGIVVIVGFCVSCFGKPIKACAYNPSDPTQWAGLVDSYRNGYEDNLTDVLHDLSTAIANGDIDGTSSVGQKYLALYALQVVALENPQMQTIFHAADLALQSVPDLSGIESLSDSYNISGKASSGLYRSLLDNNIHVVVLLPPPAIGSYSTSLSWTFASSDEFSATLSLNASSNDDPVQIVENHFNDTTSHYYVGNTGVITYYFRGNLVLQSDSYFYGSTRSEYRYGEDGLVFNIDNSNTISTLSRNLSLSLGQAQTMGWSGVSASLPNDSFDTDEPWNYYNDSLLPELRQQFPDIPDNYFVFPQGYHPAPAPDPTEPPTFPNGGINIDKQYNIGINIIFPTDASGQPVTDASGETVTETEYITDTSPLDGEYSFQMPTLAKLNMYDATLPNPDLSQYADGMTWIWNMSYNVLTDSGFMPVIMIVFALALFGFILWKLGG